MTPLANLAGVLDPRAFTGGLPTGAGLRAPILVATLFLGCVGLTAGLAGATRRAARPVVGCTLLAVALLLPGPVAETIWSLPGLSLMNPMRALGFVVLGVSLLAGFVEEPGSRARGAAGVGLVGAGTLLMLERTLYPDASLGALMVALGIGLAAVLLAARGGRASWLIAFLLILERAWGLGGFNVWSEPGELFPSQADPGGAAGPSRGGPHDRPGRGTAPQSGDGIRDTRRTVL